MAGTTHQCGPPYVPFGHVDDMEGLVVVYAPTGELVHMHDHGRTLIDSRIHGSN